MVFLKNVMTISAIVGLVAGATYWKSIAQGLSPPAEIQAPVLTTGLKNEAEFNRLRLQARSATREERWSEVVPLCEQLVTWTEDDEFVWSWLGYGYMIQGDYARAEEVWKYTLRFVRFRENTLYNLACTQSLLGKRDEAVETFRDLLDTGFANYDLVVRDQDFFALRGDPEFESLMDKLSKRDVMDF